MNYMTSAKTLYKAAQFGIIVVAVMALCVPSAVVMARGKLVYNGHTSSTTTDPNGGSTGNIGSNGTNNPVIVPDSEISLSTEPAINVKTTSALIQGGAHVDSGTAAVWFEWGTRIDKLENTTRKVYVDRMSTGSSEMLTNLAPGTKYYYRIVAHNATGTCYGTIKSFVTAGTAKVTTTTKKSTIIKTASASESESSSVTTSRSNDSIKGSLSAAAANANGSSGVLPNSILGWIVVIVLVFVIAVVVRAIQREGDMRKKREEEAKKAKAA
jgi:hypothetical protein